MNSLNVARLFSMPAFEGLRAIRFRMQEHPGQESSDAIRAVEVTASDAHALDLEAAEYLHSVVDQHCDLSEHVFYQTCIRCILVHHKPNWAKLMGLGRKRFTGKLDSDSKSLFKAAGLLAEDPNLEVVQWWDEVTGFARRLIGLEKMIQARKAEQLTIIEEKKRLLEEGIDINPKWVGFEDNTAGYDVLSYEKGSYGAPENRLIEVKSTTASPPRFFVSRNEWNQADKAGKKYIFHIWEMNKPSPLMHERSVEQIRPHIPSDNGAGQWREVEIKLQNS